MHACMHHLSRNADQITTPTALIHPYMHICIHTYLQNMRARAETLLSSHVAEQKIALHEQAGKFMAEARQSEQQHNEDMRRCEAAKNDQRKPSNNANQSSHRQA